MKVKSESEVAQSCLTLPDRMDCSLPGSSIHGIFPGKSTGVGCHCLLHIYILLLLSRISRVRLCATPWTAVYQASPPMGFSRQEHWSGLPFPSTMHESESEVIQSCPTLSDPMDCSLPGSSIHRIFRATVLESGAIAFSRRYMLYYIYLYFEM